MEEKIRQILTSIGKNNINLNSEFAREQILADIMRVVKITPQVGVTPLLSITDEDKQQTGMPEYFDYENE